MYVPTSASVRHGTASSRLPAGGFAGTDSKHMSSALVLVYRVAWKSFYMYKFTIHLKLYMTCMLYYANHCRAMNSEKNKDLFLKQVEQILDGIKKDKEKVGI